VFFKVIKRQLEIQESYLNDLMKEILKAFGYPELPRREVFSLEILFKEPFYAPTVAFRTEYGYEPGYGLVPLTLEVRGAGISSTGDFSPLLQLEVTNKGEDSETCPTKQILLSRVDDINNRVHTPEYDYLFTGSTLHQLLAVLRENAGDKAQCKKWPRKEEVVRPC